jgi:hypothetical protein
MSGLTQGGGPIDKAIMYMLWTIVNAVEVFGIFLMAEHWRSPLAWMIFGMYTCSLWLKLNVLFWTVHKEYTSKK